jgi:polyisoprenoid-binding protein YceI
MVDGVERPDLLGEDARKEIDSNIIKSVLDANAYKEIVLTSSSVTKQDSSYLVKGTLTVRGVTREITFTVREEGGFYIADVKLNLPDFGIRPFSAMFGMIKIRPDVLVRVMAPKDEEKG